MCPPYGKWYFKYLNRSMLMGTLKSIPRFGVNLNILIPIYCVWLCINRLFLTRDPTMQAKQFLIQDFSVQTFQCSQARTKIFCRSSLSADPKDVWLYARAITQRLGQSEYNQESCLVSGTYCNIWADTRPRNARCWPSSGTGPSGHLAHCHY